MLWVISIIVYLVIILKIFNCTFPNSEPNIGEPFTKNLYETKQTLENKPKIILTKRNRQVSGGEESLW